MIADGMYEIILLALCVWREARGEPKIAQTGVAWTVKNRTSQPGWWGCSIVSCILAPWQYSSFNSDDANSTKFPAEDDPSWQQSLEVAQDVWQDLTQDPTSGCQNYYDKSLDAAPPVWARDGSFVHIVDLGSLRFWRKAA